MAKRNQAVRRPIVRGILVVTRLILGAALPVLGGADLSYAQDLPMPSQGGAPAGVSSPIDVSNVPVVVDLATTGEDPSVDVAADGGPGLDVTPVDPTSLTGAADTSGFAAPAGLIPLKPGEPAGPAPSIDSPTAVGCVSITAVRAIDAATGQPRAGFETDEPFYIRADFTNGCSSNQNRVFRLKFTYPSCSSCVPGLVAESVASIPAGSWALYLGRYSYKAQHARIEWEWPFESYEQGTTAPVFESTKSAFVRHGQPAANPPASPPAEPQPASKRTLLVNVNSLKCVEVQGNGSDDGRNILQFQCNGTGAQTWRIDAIPAAGGSGYDAQIVHEASGKCMDVANSGTADGTNIRLWSCNKTGAQRFKVRPEYDTVHTLVNVGSGKCVDVSNSSLADGANVQLWSCNGTKAQRFQLEKPESWKSFQPAPAAPTAYCDGKRATIVAKPGQVTHGTGDDDVIVGTDGPDEIWAGGGADTICGLSGDDKIYGDAAPDRILGGGGNDLLHGNDGRDEIYGDSGNDVIRGDGSDDLLEGGTGNDFIEGNYDNDKLYGQDGNDKLYGGRGHDRVSGGDGADEVYGDNALEEWRTDGDDEMYGGDGADALEGQGGDDEMYGDDGRDKMYGRTGNDTLYGRDDEDWLEGNSGDDDLYGDDGDDTLRGGDNWDTLDGRAGTDVCDGGSNDWTIDDWWNCERLLNLP